MIENAFLDSAPAPDAATFASALGDALGWYDNLLAECAGFDLEWKFYGKKYGWKLKVHDGQKMLLELTVGPQQFRVGMAVREVELAALRSDPALQATLGDLLSPEKSSEGWGIRLVVDSAEQAARACALVNALRPLRLRG